MYPPGAIAALRSSGLTPDDLAYQSKKGPPRPVSTFVGGGLVLAVARNHEGARLIELEVTGRRWAEQHDIATSTVIDVCPNQDWMLARWIDPLGSASGPEYVAAALETADRIMRLPLPAQATYASTWRSRRRTLIIRSARLTIGGVPVRHWYRTRGRASALTRSATAHGDFYFRNVLPGPTCVYVIDWEFLGSAPMFTDHLRLWSTLKCKQDRRQVLDHLLSSADPDTWAHICDLAAWLGLRLLAENLSAPRRFRNPADLAHARVIAREADRIAKLRARPGDAAVFDGP